VLSRRDATLGLCVAPKNFRGASFFIECLFEPLSVVRVPLFSSEVFLSPLAFFGVPLFSSKVFLSPLEFLGCLFFHRGFWLGRFGLDLVGLDYSMQQV
jgi:hypothetical protein